MVPVKLNNKSIPSVWNHLFDSEILNPENFFKEGKRNVSANIFTHEERFEIQIEAPGFEKEQFEINLENDQLSISGTLPETESDNKVKLVRREFNSGNFKRNFILPDTADREKIDAIYKNGILTVTIEKEPKAIPEKRSIIIK